ncbi:MAG TPA: response regulator transcription factor, partial [Nannocystis sp.]
MPATILVVDDERDLLDSLRFSLEREGFGALTAQTGGAALALMNHSPPPDLVLLDWMLPDMAGTEVCRAIRMSERTRGTPVIMVSARGEEIDRVVGFEIGADDYVTKPFSIRELLLRVRAILRRRAGEDTTADAQHFDRLRVDLDAHQVWVDDHKVALTALEFRLLTTLITRRGRVQTRDTLLADVWNMQADITTRTVDTHVQRLRKKLGPAGRYIETLRGVGYRFLVPDRARPPGRATLARAMLDPAAWLQALRPLAQVNLVVPLWL